MSVEEHNLIDFVSTGADRTVTLSVSDHLAWDTESEHLSHLKTKLNRYFDFINSGELVDRFPEAADHRLFIRVHFLHAPTSTAEEFLNRFRTAAEEEGVGFIHGPITSSRP